LPFSNNHLRTKPVFMTRPSVPRSGTLVARSYLDLRVTDAVHLANDELDSGEFAAFLGELDPVMSLVPHLFLGTDAPAKEDALRLAFLGELASTVSGLPCPNGVFVTRGGNPSRVKLTALTLELASTLRSVRTWTNHLPTEPRINLNDHCPICPFRTDCRSKAEHEDNLTLLDRMTPKALRQYEKRGIRTITQLSYLYRPRRSRCIQSPTKFNLELQALALRTGKVYLHETPVLPKSAVELYLDVEGLPGSGFQYLAGVIVCRNDCVERHSFWADSAQDEAKVIQGVIGVASDHPSAPIYHYGSVERRWLARAAKGHRPELDCVLMRLVNVTKLIFGKVYFPTRSNSLKALGKLLGVAWHTPDASGLASIAWRYQWEATGQLVWKDRLLAYNLDDCHALQRLVAELKTLAETADSRPDVDFADRPKRNTTTNGASIHECLYGILRSAHAEYREKRIGIQKKATDSDAVRRGPGAPKGHSAYQRVIPSKARRIVRVRRKLRCPRHKSEWLKVTDDWADQTVVDLRFTKSGCRKTVTRYVGQYSFCPSCQRRFLPPRIQQGRGRLFGHGFRAWTVYQRVSLRLPYRAICQAIDDRFEEYVSVGSAVSFIPDIARLYTLTEQRFVERLLEGPYIHVDETKLNIRGTNHFVWVLTDGTHVVFRLTETRETALIQKILTGYKGVIVSDFYGGFDSCPCRQQKCLVHLIREMNDELWRNPFNRELEQFIASFKELIVPIMDDVRKYGLKRRHLCKHDKEVIRFYRSTVAVPTTGCEIVDRFKKRFLRYRDSLFHFLLEDGIPWNNNTAERAIRHLAVQRKISGSFFKRVAVDYLRLLGISQTCRFQGKSFLRFLLSQERDVDRFKEHRRKKPSRLIAPHCASN
jgi:predicted RecB family nuclease